MRQLRWKSLVATTNALSTFVVDSCTGAGKPTRNAGDSGPPNSFIVATNAVRFPRNSGGLQIIVTLHEARLIQDDRKIGSPRPNAGEGLGVRGITFLLNQLPKIGSG